jgi:hypothetical protein
MADYGQTGGRMRARICSLQLCTRRRGRRHRMTGSMPVSPTTIDPRFTALQRFLLHSTDRHSGRESANSPQEVRADSGRGDQPLRDDVEVVVEQSGVPVQGESGPRRSRASGGRPSRCPSADGERSRHVTQLMRLTDQPAGRHGRDARRAWARTVRRHANPIGLSGNIKTNYRPHHEIAGVEIGWD